MTLDRDDAVIGFIGTGVMGKSMAKNLLAAGYRVAVHTRTRQKADELLQLGADWRETVADAARDADLLITMVGYPHDVQSVYFGEAGVLAHARPGAYVVDMTTSSPALAERISEEAGARGLRALDAPVSGGDVGAKEGTLTIMVGGEVGAFDAVKPVLEVLGRNIVLQGPAGSGQYTKMCNQIAIASNMVGVCEAIAYAERAGLDPSKVLDSIGAGAAGSWSLTQLAPRMLAGDFEPGFYVKHFVKDMRIALESARELGLTTPGLELAASMYERLEKQGDGERGTQALYKLYEEGIQSVGA